MPEREREREEREFDVNKASVTLFMKVEGIDRDIAQKIVDYRDQHGPFHNWSDLERIPGLRAALLEKLKNSGATLGGKKAA